MKNQLLPFSLIWLPFGKKNKYHLLSDKFNGSLPWFIWGSELEQFKENNSFSLREEYLLKGILYGMSPDAFKVGVTYNEEDFLIILEKLRVGFKSHDMEEMICGVAYSIKTINGVSPCLSILRTGMHLLPNSSEIKSDYIIGLWEKSYENEDNEGIYKEILELIPKIDLEDIYGDAKESIYEIQSKIDSLSNNSDKKFTPKELKILDEIVSCHQKGKSYKHLEDEFYTIISDAADADHISTNHVPTQLRNVQYEVHLDKKDVTDKEERFSLFKQALTYSDPHNFIVFINHKKYLIAAQFKGLEWYSNLEVFDNLEQFYLDYKKKNYALVEIDESVEDQGKYPPLNFNNEELFDLWCKFEQ